MAKTTLSKTVFIGLGGTGAQALVRTKSLMIDNFGEIPPMIKFLAIDTDGVEKVFCKNKRGQKIMLDETEEYIHLTVPDINKYVNANRTVTDFFHKDLLRKKTSITEGAGQFRSCGRLSLIANDNDNLRSHLINTINSVARWEVTRDSKYQINSHAPTRVFVVFSMAGGTGAGLFIDFPLLIKGDKSIADEAGIKTIAIGLLPDVYASLGVVAANCKPNAITGITEYELIADGYLEEKINSPQDPGRRVITASGNYPVEANNLYDSFFVVNNESSSGIKYTTIHEMEDLISMALFLAAGATGGQAESALDNMNALKTGQALRGKMLRYLGLGCGEMVFDSKQVAQYYSLLQTKHLCENVLNSSEQYDINEKVRNHLYDWNIQEDENKDDVIIYLSSSKKKSHFSGVHEFDESTQIAIRSKRDAHIRMIQKDLTSLNESGGSLDQLIERSISNIETLAKNKINTISGLNYIKQVFPELIGRFKGMIDELSIEQERYQQKITDIRAGYDMLLTEIQDAASISRFNFFRNRAKAIEYACDEYVVAVNTEVENLYEVELRNAAIALYRKIIELTENLLKKTTDFEIRLRKVIVNTAREIQRIKSKNPMHPFTIHLTPDYISKMDSRSKDADIEIFLKNINLSNYVFEKVLDSEELYATIADYCEKLDKTKDYNETTILDVLQDMPEEKVREHFKSLKNATQILRRLNPNYTGIDNAINYVIGVSDVNHPAIIDKNKALEVEIYSTHGVQNKLSPGDILRSVFSFHGRVPELSNTNDPNKIIVSSYESAVPAFLIKNFEGYQFDMESKKNTIPEKIRYANKFWGDVIMKHNYSIFPKNEDDVMTTWVLAFFVSQVEKEKKGTSAMQFITKPKNGKYAVYTSTGDRTMVDLDTNRVEAYEMFRCQQGLINDLLPRIKQKIKDDQRTYREKLKELKEDYTGDLYISTYSNHNLAKNTYNSKANENTRKLVMEEFRFLQAADISDFIS